VPTANPNANKLDDKDSSEIGRELWVHVNSNGTLVRGNGVQSTERFSAGYYLVQFNRDVPFCGYVATTNRVDLPFHLVVTCSPSTSRAVMAGEKDGREEPGSQLSRGPGPSCCNGMAVPNTA
jgi:hypothetical protein